MTDFTSYGKTIVRRPHNVGLPPGYASEVFDLMMSTPMPPSLGREEERPPREEPRRVGMQALFHKWQQTYYTGLLCLRRVWPDMPPEIEALIMKPMTWDRHSCWCWLCLCPLAIYAPDMASCMFWEHDYRRPVHAKCLMKLYGGQCSEPDPRRNPFNYGDYYHDFAAALIGSGIRYIFPADARVEVEPTQKDLYEGRAFLSGLASPGALFLGPRMTHYQRLADDLYYEELMALDRLILGEMAQLDRDHEGWRHMWRPENRIAVIDETQDGFRGLRGPVVQWEAPFVPPQVAPRDQSLRAQMVAEERERDRERRHVPKAGQKGGRGRGGRKK
jgi:hypothetical protein